MTLNECRNEIDEINKEINRLFIRRMEVSSEVAKFKRENNLPILQPKREAEILSEVKKDAPPYLASYSAALFSAIMALGRAYQSSQNGGNELSKSVNAAREKTPKAFPESAVVACQGVEGAYSQIAAGKIFKEPKILYFKTFDAVFSAIEQGLCQYGILPIENSIHGSVNQVYDLMKNHNFYISRGIKLKINHCLLGKSGARLSDITDIYSHEQAIGQCGEFLKAHSNIRVHVCENTAVAAKKVALCKDCGAASISSPECAACYGLSTIKTDIADSKSNFTRFICISKNLEIYQDADKISLVLLAEHKPAALYSLITRFAALGLNITKLESRPIAGRDFEYRFYFDIEASTATSEVLSLIADLCDGEGSVFLGNYSEIQGETI